MKKINASDFKARCLALLDEVKHTGVVITILKRGQPVAQIGPIQEDIGETPQHSLIGSVKIEGDILAPVLDPDEIDLESDHI